MRRASTTQSSAYNHPIWPQTPRIPPLPQPFPLPHAVNHPHAPPLIACHHPPSNRYAAEDFHYLNQSGCYVRKYDGVDDIDQFNDTCAAMKTVGLTGDILGSTGAEGSADGEGNDGAEGEGEGGGASAAGGKGKGVSGGGSGSGYGALADEQGAVFAVVAALLHLGNMSFESSEAPFPENPPNDTPGPLQGGQGHQLFDTTLQHTDHPPSLPLSPLPPLPPLLPLLPLPSLPTSPSPRSHLALTSPSPGAERLSADGASAKGMAISVDNSSTSPRLSASRKSFGGGGGGGGGGGDQLYTRARPDSARVSAARLLGVDEHTLSETLSTRTIRAREDTYVVAMEPAQAEANRDALAKAVYNQLFLWLVDRINKSLSTSHGAATATNKSPARRTPTRGVAASPGGGGGGVAGSSAFIGVLDIFGFEVSEGCSHSPPRPTTTHHDPPRPTTTHHDPSYPARRCLHVTHSSSSALISVTKSSSSSLMTSSSV